MSLFKAHEFWSVNLNVPDAFDGHNLLIETINNTLTIFLGSHDGYLRAFYPTNENEPSEYKPADLLYETLFPVPVLQMTMGRFISGSNARQLAILHPKLVSVYNVHLSEKDGDYPLSLKHVYQHSLQRTSYGMVAGSFGNVDGRDFLCVQSLDGLISFFEQETATFQVNLPDFLLPMPFRYIHTMDAFIFQDCQHYLKCYTFEELSRKSFKPIWMHNIGDLILDINVRWIGPDVHILALTERHLLNLNDGGKIEWMKQFEFQPICFYSFVNNDSIMSIICTDSSTINIYEQTCLKWCAKIDFLPVCCNLCNLTANPGLIILLSDAGLLQCVYMGTVPSLYLIPPTAELEINVSEAENELKQLQLKITDTEIEQNGDCVKLQLVIDGKLKNGGKICNGFVKLTTLTPVNNVQVTIKIDPPFISTISCITVPSIVKDEQINFEITVNGLEIPSNLTVFVTISYFLTNGAARIAQEIGQLPFELIADSAMATKDAPIKVTLTTNKPTWPLNELFNDFEASSNAVGFEINGFLVTIAAAKTSQRYRIQGNSYEDLTLVLETFLKRLKNVHKKFNDFSLNFSGPLPITAYFEVVEKYFELVTRRRLLQDQLAQRTSQYRTIQKKILVGLNDLTPKPNLVLYKVLDDTYGMIRIVINDLEKLEIDLNVVRSRVASMSRLLLILFEIMAVNKTDLDFLRLAFNPRVYDNEEQGWLEAQNATLSLLLRTVLAKSSKDQNKPLELTLDPLSDVSKLCKLFSNVVDRATKGTSLMERAEYEKENLPTVPSIKEWKQSELKILPDASKFTDFNAPVPEKTKKVEIEEEPKVVYIETEAIIESHNWRENEETPKQVLEPEQDSIWDINLDELNI